MGHYKSILTTLFVICAGLSVKAEELSFSSVWKTISNKSYAQRVGELESEAVKAAASRTSHHWIPRIYLNVKSYQTNDPGSSFIALLEQRSVANSDFNPDAINHPEQHTYTQGTLGIDLPLYEGGLKVSEYRMQKHFSKAAEKENNKIQNEQYAEVAKAYGSIGVLSEQKNKLLELFKTLERVQKNYKLGSKANPVGHSGYLGLKSISNKLQGLIMQYEGQSEAYYQALKEMGLDQNINWKPKFNDTLSFTNQYLSNKSYNESSTVQSLNEKAMASKEISSMEKARYLPRLGAFAESYAFNGNRDKANSYVAGMYLQWNLFNPSDYGTYKESKLRASAAENYAKAISVKEQAEYQALVKTSDFLKANIELLNDSQKLMSEQIQVTENLFRNGSVNAIQFVEVLSKNLDLISNQTDAHLGLIKADADKILRTNFLIPTEAEGKTL